MTFDLSALVNLLAGGVVVVVAAVWLRSKLTKQRHEDLTLLVETRGERIKDQDARIHELELRLEKLAGEVKALHLLKAAEIADEIVARLDMARVRKDMREIHALVNSRMTEALDRIDQLNEALARAGVRIPAEPPREG